MYFLIIRRFIEVTGFCVLFSVILAMMSRSTVSMVNGLVPISMMILTLVYVILNVLMLRRCYYDIMGIRDYYTGNVVAYLVFAIINIVVCILFNDVIYTWLFAITKFARFFGENVSKIESALIFHLIMLMVIFVAPVGMKEIYAWRFK